MNYVKLIISEPIRLGVRSKPESATVDSYFVLSAWDSSDGVTKYKWPTRKSIFYLCSETVIPNTDCN